MGTSSVDLPFEIIELILPRCPAKSVVRFKSVSKSWLSIISGPRFSTAHRIQRSKLLGNLTKLLVWTKDSNGYRCIYLMRMEDGKFQRESVVCDSSLSPLCYCDGLFLIGLSFSKPDYMLWNPSIRKHHTITLSEPTGPIPKWWHHIYHDATTDDYKIVFRYPQYCYKIYSSRNQSWGETKQFPSDVRSRSIHSVFVDGCLYVARDNEVVCFDVRDGKLHRFPKPNDVECCVTADLREVSGRLCLYGFNRVAQSVEMWVMENKNNKCWRKLLCVHKLEKVRKLLCVHKLEKVSKFYEYLEIRPLCLGNEDDVVFRASYPGMTTTTTTTTNIMYNPREKSMREVDFNWEWSLWCPYLENLYMSPNLLQTYSSMLA